MQDEPEFFEVYEENWQTLQLFIAMSTQWLWTGGMESHRAGLNYAVLDFQFEMAGVRKKDRPNVFYGLQLMERAALDVWHQMHSKKN